MERCCLYCGSSRGDDPAYMQAAGGFGAELARRGIGLVYGGAAVGLMGQAAAACLDAGGCVTGVITGRLLEMGVARKEITELIVVESMHERKERMAALSDAFVAMPGGIGTLEEIFEVLTWMQLGIHDKPVAFLNTGGFYDGLLAFLESVCRAGFLRREHLDAVIVESEPSTLVDRLRAWRAPKAGKWFDIEANRV